jgi:hypothetical protein
MQLDIGLWLVGLDADHVDPRIVAVLSVSDTGSWRCRRVWPHNARSYRSYKDVSITM